ncbi:hypothetical protein [Camelliibacillus cellulosilyticus]
MLLSIFSVTAFAKNASDTSFEFVFKPFLSPTLYTSARAKEDNSSAYMKVKSMPAYAINASVVRSDYSEFSKTWVYRFDSSDVNKGRYLANYAYEDDGYHVKVRIKAIKAVSPAAGFVVSGVWSPDSI